MIDQRTPVTSNFAPNRFRLLENLFDAIAVLTSSRHLVYVNERFRRLAKVGVQNAAFSSSKIDVAEYLDVPAICWDHLKSQNPQLAPQINSVPFTFTSGAKGFAQFTVDALPLEPGSNETLYMCVLRDITLELQSKWQLDENERLISQLRRSHTEAQFLWRLSMETPIYIEPAAVLTTVARKLREELGFSDACFLYTPETDQGFPEPILLDNRVGSRLREVANALIPVIRNKRGRSEVWSMEYEQFGTFWIVSFKPKVERPFFLLARSELSAKDSNRRGFLDPLAMQITGWLDNRSMYISSITDSLTGLFNRRHFDSRFAVECLLTRERQNILSLILVDIDFFKKINDSFGHQVGDTVLKIMGTALKNVLRTSDITARVGGEEFAVLLFDTSPIDAQIAAEKIRKKIAETPIPVPGFGQNIHITVSCGIAGYVGGDDTPESVYGAADEALYRAKANGRNRIEISLPTILEKVEKTP